MAAKVASVNVATPEQMQHAIMSYVAQGFVVSTQTADTTTLFKKKEFNILWAVIGFFLCLIPLLIYCIVYATQSDEMIVIRIDPSAAMSMAPGTVPGLSQPSNTDVELLTWSEDRKYWWTGTTWIDSLRTVPPGAKYSEDGLQWWDGRTWRSASADIDTATNEASQASDASPPTAHPEQTDAPPSS